MTTLVYIIKKKGKIKMEEMFEILENLEDIFDKGKINLQQYYQEKEKIIKMFHVKQEKRKGE